jgi:hypothetical protein
MRRNAALYTRTRLRYLESKPTYTQELLDDRLLIRYASWSVAGALWASGGIVVNANKSRRVEEFTKADFYRLATDIFGFLISEYGFGQGEWSQGGREGMWTFKRCPVAVSISIEGRSMPDTMVEWVTHEGEDYAGLQCLTKRLFLPRYPKLAKPVEKMRVAEYVDTFSAWLRIQADYLKTHGKRFLAGDYSQIPANKAKARERIAAARKRAKKNSKGQD